MITEPIRLICRRQLLIAGLLLSLAVPGGTAFSESNSPKQVIEGYYSTLLNAMQNAKKLGYKGRYDLLSPAVDKTFNIAVMAQQSVGSFWDQMTDDQRAALVTAFRDFTIANYAHSFDDFTGEQFLTTDEKETPRKDFIVYTTLVKSDGDKVVLNYLLRQDKDAYKVIDVFLEGSISQLATRRSEYTSLIRQNGVDALIAAIRKKAEDLAN